MLNNISWASYIYAITIILILYYSFVLIVFYRSELQSFLQQVNNRSKRPWVNKDQPTGNADKDILQNATPDNAKENSLAGLFLNLQSLIKNAAARNFPKEELLLSLQLRLNQHIASVDTSIKNTLNDFIISECISYCSIHLSEDEVSALWNI